jgi:ELWxxDGT repeat protein
VLNDLTDVAGRLFFSASDPAAGEELWQSDGTEGGTVRVRDINPGPGSSTPFPSYWCLFGCRRFAALDGTLLFVASEPSGGAELWRSDGTDPGTLRVKDIRPGGAGSFVFPYDLTTVGGTLFFRANDGVNGTELWKSDGTEAGTMMVKDIHPDPAAFGPEGFARLGSSLLFAANEGTSGYEPWKSDGTEAGTVLVKDIYPGSQNGLGGGIVAANGVAFFSANDGASGYELWRSDGTEAGTMLVKDINPGAGGSSPFLLTRAGGLLYFLAFSPSSGNFHQLWRSDGTEAGTVLVKNFTPENPYDDPDISWLAEVDGELFFRANDSVIGSEVWHTDGTEAGTAPVRDIRAGGNAIPVQITSFAGAAYFRAFEDSTGYELWRSDGTEAGTSLVADVNPGPESSYETSPFVSAGGGLTKVGATLFFGARQPDTGFELWALTAEPHACEVLVGRQLEVIAPRAGSDPSRRRVRIVAGRAAMPDGLAADPVAHGATLEIELDGATPSSQSFELPASGWRRAGSFTSATGAAAEAAGRCAA